MCYPFSAHQSDQIFVLRPPCSASPVHSRRYPHFYNFASSCLIFICHACNACKSDPVSVLLDHLPILYSTWVHPQFLWGQNYVLHPPCSARLLRSRRYSHFHNFASPCLIFIRHPLFDFYSSANLIQFLYLLFIAMQPICFFVLPSELVEGRNSPLYFCFAKRQVVVSV